MGAPAPDLTGIGIAGEAFTNLADTVMVMLNAAIFYVYSVAIIAVLLLFALHNRKTGWRPNRNNAELVTLLDLCEGWRAVRETLPSPERFRPQLMALSAALERLTPTALPGAEVAARGKQMLQ